jgi:hypothetical protein
MFNIPANPWVLENPVNGFWVGRDCRVEGLSTRITPSDESELFDLTIAEAEGDRVEAARCDGGENECIRDKTSIFSSFSSKRSFKSLTSVSKLLTRSSSDSVYPRGKARRLSLSLVRHSKPTLAHCEQQGRTPSQRIFLLRHRSQA